MTAEERVAGKQAEFQCFLSLLICQIFSYKSISLFSFSVFKRIQTPSFLFCRFLTLVGGFSLVIFGFGVCEDVRLEVGRLCKLLIAAVKGTDVGSVSSVDAHVCAQVEVQRKPLPTAFKGTLERFLPCVNELVTFEFGALDESLAALCADMHARSVGVEMLPHG